MNKTETTTYGQKLVASEIEKVESYASIDFDVESPTVINVNYKGVNMGRLIMQCRNFTWSPLSEGFDIELIIRNINPK